VSGPAVIGIDLGGTNVRAGVVVDGRLARVETRTIRGQGTEAEVLEDLFGAVDSVAGPGVAGIGAGVPSIIDLKTGTVYDVQNIPSWTKVPLKGLLEDRYRLPAYVNNDANCFAAGEKIFGKLAPYDNAVGLIVGTGLGAGVIANGRLFSGVNCGAGEFGMLPYLDRNFEAYASGQFFRRVHDTTGREAAERADRGDRAALLQFEEFGRHLGEAVKAICYAVDPPFPRRAVADVPVVRLLDRPGAPADRALGDREHRHPRGRRPLLRRAAGLTAAVRRRQGLAAGGESKKSR
jgi:glucokinase